MLDLSPRTTLKKLFPPRIIAILACVGLLSFLSGSSFGTDVSGVGTRISLLMVTGMPGGSFHHLGLAMASMWTTKLKKVGIRVSAAISEGARENVEAIRIEDADLILADDLSCDIAYRGFGGYKDKRAGELRSIVNLWPEAVHLIIRSDRKTNFSLDDLEGLTVATGLPESGNRFTTEILARTLKNQKSTIKFKFMNYGSAVDSLRTGAVDAADVTSAIPSALVINLLQPDPGLFSFLQISDAELRSAQELGWSSCRRIVIPPDVYPGQDKPINTVGQNTLLATSSSLDPEVIYDLTRTLFENIDQLAKFHPAFKNVTLENALHGLVAPLHPGAVRYYREKDVHIPEALLPPNVE
jgi:TRAP transporter TAXI family solute receptor